MILAYIQNTETSEKLLQSALNLAKSLDKKPAVLCADFVSNQEKQALAEKHASAETLIFQENADIQSIADFCEENEISFLFLQAAQYNRKSLQKLLNACRNLRIPYLIFRDDFEILKMDKVLVPVNFLEEEIEKAQFATAFGRFCNSEITLLQANDYGSKSAATVARMTELFSKFSFVYQIIKAKKDSFKVDEEALGFSDTFGLILVSASREYGLDDLIFGPKELHLIRKTSIPVLLVNPRGDLYALCD